MDAARHKEIMSHAELQFGPQWITLRTQHNSELRDAQFRARQTHNSAAMLPAESACYVSHAKALVIAKANAIADAYTIFNEPVGGEAEAELVSFFDTVVAARKSSFQGEILLRQMRTRMSTHQVAPLLCGFERQANSALIEGRAILNRQRVLMKNRPRSAQIETKYVVDTSVFNWVTDSLITRDQLPSDGGFAITHIQVDEINQTKDGERRARLALTQACLYCRLLPTETLVLDVSRIDHAKLGDGRLFSSLKAELDILNGKKRNNARDALIAEVAIANGYTLLTADADLRSASEQHGGKVIFFSAPKINHPSDSGM
jgi:predicted nucleic acid-binding protein